MKLASIVGARPNFMKLAPLARVLASRPDVEHFVVHTGQHYDASMSDDFFRDLAIPEPRYHLAVGSGSHAAQTAAVMQRLEPVLIDERPDVVIVYGDVNSTAAAALTAAKLGLRVAHVEAGLRSGDRSMPEEINRLVTDAIADLLLAPSPDAVANLRAEGHPDHRIHFVGNIMIDVLVDTLARPRPAGASPRPSTPYLVATLHRPANVDDPARLAEIMTALDQLSAETPVVFPVHPRTRQRLAARATRSRVQLVDPLGYPDMAALVAGARGVITDSGGLQEETTYLGVPCLTVRPNTERPITCTLGTNRLVPAEQRAIVAQTREALRARPAAAPVIERWDGHTADRIASLLCDGVAPH
ncbi:MAG TPA: UDP-N-acetylglucosamine 2-epimerase (non-hydrolyzing) [Gemmatimonadaceae bacterium]|nr:UDP-N-acetylglucosamine 2-epimerase (non-hydrolyzing) [Gemmatimonadaceae bacterium]